MSDRPRYTMRQSIYRVRADGFGPMTAYAMILDTWYCYREVWRLDVTVGGGGNERAARVVNEQAVARFGWNAPDDEHTRRSIRAMAERVITTYDDGSLRG